MRLDTIKRIGGRPVIEAGAPVEHRFQGLKSRDIIASETGESREQIRRYIRLNELVPEILNLVDDGMIAMRPAVEISYLPEESQKQLFDAMGANDCTPSHDQTIRMRKAFNEGRLTKEVVDTIMCEEKPNRATRS